LSFLYQTGNIKNCKTR